MKKVRFCLFFLYCAWLAEILLLGRTAERSLSVREYFLTYANICPFQTLVRYTVYFIKRRDWFSLRLALFNIGGNFVLFIPMGFFLPVLFPRLRRFRKALFVILGTVLAAELLQGILRVGVPDIDDLAVNAAGACLGILLGKAFAGTRKK